jgi:soluble lytic murein transglycosylase-like protein
MSTARRTTPEELDQLVQKTAEKHRVDPRLVRAVIATESNWNATAVSRKGAQGLMQLIPETAQQLGVADAFDPAQNVDGGVRYLSMMLERYNGDVHMALAAYNAGPGAVDRSGGMPRFQETRNYVQKVTSAYLGGTGLQPRAMATAARIPIYRAVDADGRVVFRNE